LTRQHSLAVALMFAFMAIYSTVAAVFEAINPQDIVIPIPHEGYFTIVASDYMTWIIIGALGEIAFSLVFLVRYWTSPKKPDHYGYDPMLAYDPKRGEKQDG
jgi:hypothetical protein